MPAEPEFSLTRYRGVWCVLWYDAEGSRHRNSLSTADRVQAAEELKLWVSNWRERNKPDRITVRYAWEGYRASLGPKPAAVTMGHEWKALEPFFGDMSADGPTEADCEDYIALRRAAGRKDGTIWTELGHLRSALKWAEKKNHIAKAPTIWRPDRPEPRNLRLTKSQVSKFLKACELPHVRLFVILAMTTGARSGALLDLKWDRIDFAAGLIHLRDPEARQTNKGRALVPMNETSRKALTTARDGAVSPFVVEWGGKRVASVKKGLKGAGARAGLPWVTAHVFRHSAATHMAEAGVPMEKIAQFLGHSDSRLTERVYARFSPTFLKDAASSLEIDLE